MTGVVLPYPLLPHQLEARDLLRRFSVLAWHRRGGKTVFAVKRVASAALGTKTVRGRFGYVAPFYRQARAVAWDYLKAMLRPVPGVTFNETELSAELGNGAQVRLFGADNPDALRGLYWDGVVLDEVADMRPNVWGEIIRPALTDREGWALFIGTPKGVNLFSELYYRGLQGGDDDWYAETRRASETGALSAEELAKAKREMTESQYAQEMECDFSAAVDNVLISLDAVLEAQRRSYPASHIEGDPVIIGLDVARYGDDRSVAVIRQGDVCYKPRVWRKMDLMSLAGQVAMLADEWRPAKIFVDQGGLGAGALDRLVSLGMPAVGVDFGGKALDPRFLRRRSEMWWKLAEWVKTAMLPAGQDIVVDLTAPTYSYANAAGKLELESKDDMKERGLDSPDIGDALALTFAEPVAHLGLDIMRRLLGTERARTSYDPFAQEAVA